MPVPTFELTERAGRRLFAIYVDVSENGEVPEWEVQGYGSEEAALEFSPEDESFTDVLGIQHNYILKLERSMTLEPNTIRPIGLHGKLNPILHEYTRKNQLEKLAAFKVLLVYWYTASKEADMYPMCTIIPQSLGGGASTDFPYEIKLGGEPVFGTAEKTGGSVKFMPTGGN